MGAGFYKKEVTFTLNIKDAFQKTIIYRILNIYMLNTNILYDCCLLKYTDIFHLHRSYFCPTICIWIHPKQCNQLTYFAKTWSNVGNIFQDMDESCMFFKMTSFYKVLQWFVMCSVQHVYKTSNIVFAELYHDIWSQFINMQSIV